MHWIIQRCSHLTAASSVTPLLLREVKENAEVVSPLLFFMSRFCTFWSYGMEVHCRNELHVPICKEILALSCDGNNTCGSIFHLRMAKLLIKMDLLNLQGPLQKRNGQLLFHQDGKPGQKGVRVTRLQYQNLANFICFLSWFYI